MVIFLHCNGEITVNKTCSCSLQCYNTHFNISLLQIKTVFLSQNQWQYIFFSPTPNLQGILRFPEYTWDTSSKKYTREVTDWSVILYPIQQLENAILFKMDSSHVCFSTNCEGASGTSAKMLTTQSLSFSHISLSSQSPASLHRTELYGTLLSLAAAKHSEQASLWSRAITKQKKRKKHQQTKKHWRSLVFSAQFLELTGKEGREINVIYEMLSGIAKISICFQMHVSNETGKCLWKTLQEDPDKLCLKPHIYVAFGRC